MNRRVLQIAKREMHAILTARQFWLAYGLVVVLLTVTGPMYSHSDFAPFPRAAYWAAVALATYVTSIPVVIWVVETLGRRVMPLTAHALGGLVAGLPIALVVFVINTYIAGNGSGSWHSALRLLLICPIIGMVVVSLQHMVLAHRAAPDPVQAPLLARLPLHLRGEVLSLQAQDHYVQVTTTRGRDLILIRLADAIAELGDADGIQTHRSWWVARRAIARAERGEGKAALHLHDGRSAPISRANRAAVLDWLNRSGT